MRSERTTCTRACAGALVLGVATLGLATEALADGSEMLGFIDVADGSDVIMTGVGLFDDQPGSIDVVIPAGVSIEQVLLYWNGFAATADEAGATDTIMVDGGPVTGDRIGGPDFFFFPAWSSTYRAELSPSVLAAGAKLYVTGTTASRGDGKPENAVSSPSASWMSVVPTPSSMMTSRPAPLLTKP